MCGQGQSPSQSQSKMHLDFKQMAWCVHHDSDAASGNEKDKMAVRLSH